VISDHRHICPVRVRPAIRHYERVEEAGDALVSEAIVLWSGHGIDPLASTWGAPFSATVW
jgi:hypothetical protein